MIFPWLLSFENRRKKKNQKKYLAVLILFIIYVLFLATLNLSDSPVSFYLQNCGLNKKFLPIGGITIDILIKKNVMKMHVILEHHTFPMKVTYPL